MDKEHFSNSLKKMRKSKKLTLIKLSELSGVAKSAISYYENGVRLPNTVTLHKLANALNVDPSELTDPPDPLELIAEKLFNKELNLFQAKINSGKALSKEYYAEYNGNSVCVYFRFPKIKYEPNQSKLIDQGYKKAKENRDNLKEFDDSVKDSLTLKNINIDEYNWNRPIESYFQYGEIIYNDFISTVASDVTNTIYFFNLDGQVNEDLNKKSFHKIRDKRNSTPFSGEVSKDYYWFLLKNFNRMQDEILQEAVTRGLVAKIEYIEDENLEYLDNVTRIDYFDKTGKLHCTELFDHNENLIETKKF